MTSTDAVTLLRAEVNARDIRRQTAELIRQLDGMPFDHCDFAQSSILAALTNIDQALSHLEQPCQRAERVLDAALAKRKGE